jgi:transposase InsO family protein
MLELVARHPRYSYRRIWALLRQTGWLLNRKRVHRLWKQNGLSLRSLRSLQLSKRENSCYSHSNWYREWGQAKPIED